MRINAIQNINYRPTFAENNINKPIEGQKESKISAKQIGYGIAGLAAIGLATYAIVRKGKKTSTGNIDDTANGIKRKIKTHKNPTPEINPEIPENNPKIKPKTPEETLSNDTNIIKKNPDNELNTGDIKTDSNIDQPKKSDNAENTQIKADNTSESNTDIPSQEENQTNNKIEEIKEIVDRRVKTTPEILAPYIKGTVEEKPFSITGIGETEPFEGVEILKYTMKGNGKGRTHQQFYHQNKLYQATVYDDSLGEFFDTTKVTRYNFAYENGKIAGIAKQDIVKDGVQHGIYKDGKFEPFPILVKMKGEKDFHQVEAYSIDSLKEFDKRFDPKNI